MGVARGIALDTGWVACGEKLNRSLCSLKIKIIIVGTGGTVLRFFQTTITTFIEQLIKQNSISPDD